MIRRSIRSRRKAPESLEERCLLSTITVTSLADNTDVDGEVTLREAILAANADTSVDGSVAGDGADRIEFAAGITSGKIVLTEGPLEITESLIVKAPSGKITIDAAESDRILNVSADADQVVLNQLRFRNAQDTAIVSESPSLKLLRTEFFDNQGEDGGAVRARGKLILTQSRFLRGVARNGGAASVVGEAKIKDSVFLSNQATYVTLGHGDGGALNIEGEASIESSTFENNVAVLGGAIRFVAAGGPLELQDSVISENSAGHGSAVRVDHSRLYGMRMDSTLVENNVGTRYEPAISIFGFDHEHGEDFTVSKIIDSAILNNGTDGVRLTGSEAELSLIGSTVSGHEQTGIRHVSQLTIENSTISENGTGISGPSGYTLVLNSVISNNDAVGISADRLGINESLIMNNTRGVNGSTVTIWNSTITGHQDAPVYARSRLTLHHTTVAHNNLDPGAIAVSVLYGTEAWIGNSIIAKNHRSDGDKLDLSVGEADLTLTHSLIGSNQGLDVDEARPGSPDEDGNLIGTPMDPIDPMLGIAYDNGGQTLTMASSHNSPGVNGADSELETDQIGRVRIDQPDMGAFEFDASLHADPVLVVIDTAALESAELLTFDVMATSLPAPENQTVATLDIDGGTARPSIDYQEFNEVSMTLTPTSGTTLRVDVPLTRDDTRAEPDRTVNLVVSDVSGPNGGTLDGVGTIQNDDELEVRVTPRPGIEGGGVARFDLEVINGRLEPIEVSAVTSDLTASAADGDYEATDATIQFTGRVAEVRTLAVPITDDSDTESLERFAVSFGWPFQDIDVRGEIIDNDEGVLLQGSTLRVLGTPGPDDMNITQSGDELTIVINDFEEVFDVDGVSRILIEADAGDDTIETDVNISSVIEAGDGDDTVRVLGDARDTVLGEGGDDTLFAGGGRDKVAGGSGNDLVHGDDGDDTVFGGGDKDRVYGDGGDDEVYGNGGQDTVFGSIGDDTIIGGRQKDTLNGGKGEDSITGGHGSDRILGGDGKDSILGGDGHDTILGGAGSDTINGGDRDDIIDGGTGADFIEGFFGFDIISGGPGNDRLYGDAEAFGSSTVNRIDGGHGDDLIHGYEFANGGAGDDTITGANYLRASFADGGEGDDSIVGGRKIDTINGGPGDDTLHGGEGRDLIQGGTGADFLGGGIDDDTLRGGSGNDILVGGDGVDVLNGSSGDDLLSGGLGDLDAEILTTFWAVGQSYDGHVQRVERHLNETDSIHKFDDGDADQLVRTSGRNYYLAETGLDVFSLDDNEEVFELLDP